MAKITTGTTNGDIKITPNGTGKTVVGTGAASATVQSSGNHNLVLQTGNATTGSITITDGADGNIAITPNGTGEVDISKVDIDGGTIDGTVIGGTTPAAGTFTTFTSTGIDDNASSTAMTIDASGNVQLAGSLTAGTIGSGVVFTGPFKNGSSSFSLAAGGSQTVFTIGIDEAYIVTAFYDSGETGGVFAANSWLVVRSNSNYAPSMASGGGSSANLTVAISGSNVNIGNTTGGTREITATWTRLV